jgi:hypothetical protein
MRHGTLVLAASVLGLGAFVEGCWPNPCLVQICDGPYCRCAVSACGEGASYDRRTGRCRCRQGRVLFGGHCLSPRVADAYCGAGYRWQGGGCTPVAVCRPGDELDHATGMCIPHEQVNQVASNMGINVGPGQKLGCPEGQKLVIDGQAAACVPLEQTCARDETWNGSACAKTVNTCPEGSSWDATQQQCVAFAKESPSEGLAVDVAQWAVSRFGRDGGDGQPAFCNAFAKKPWSFAVNDGSSAAVRIAVTLSFPESQIARGVVETRAVFAASGNPVPPKGAAEIDAAAKAVAAPLLEQGGRAAAPSTTTTVRCIVTNAGRPLAVPATGGL